MTPEQAEAVDRYQHSEAALRRMARQAVVEGRDEDARELLRLAKHCHMAMFREKVGSQRDKWERTYPLAEYRRVA